MLKFELDIDYMSAWGIIIVSLVALTFAFWDVNYFLRAAFVIIWGKLFEEKLNLEETSTIYGICTTSDLDLMFKHMNNARYIRELDFGRFNFYDRTGFYNAIMDVNGSIVQSACTVKYRKSITLFMTYKITTKLVYWDEKALYFEQQFISLKDNFVRAVSFSKQGTIGLNVPEILAKLLKKDISYRPTPPPELDHILNGFEASSIKLRPKEE